MEAIRRRLQEEKAKMFAPRDVISIHSSSSEKTNPNNVKMTKPREPHSVIEVTDSEEEAEDDNRPNDEDEDDDKEEAVGDGDESDDVMLSKPKKANRRAVITSDTEEDDNDYEPEAKQKGSSKGTVPDTDGEDEEEAPPIRFPEPQIAPVAPKQVDVQSKQAPAFPVPQPYVHPKGLEPFPFDDANHAAARPQPLQNHNVNGALNANAEKPSIPPNAQRLSAPVMPGALNARTPSGPYAPNGALPTQPARGLPGVFPPRPPGQPIAVPTNPPPMAHVRNDGLENFDQVQGHDTYAFEPFRNSEQVEADLKELVGDAMEEVKEDIDEDEKTVDGFEEGIELLTHQVLARRWMKERESGKKLGGILADDMGLGKTIQTIVRIVDGMPTKEDRVGGWAKSTLVVCPVGLMDQWEREIRKVASHLKVVQHHGAARAFEPAVLSRNHVVITSYSIASNEYDTFNPETKEAKQKKKAAASKAKKASGGSTTDEDDSDEIGKYLKQRKAPAKKKKLCALYGVQWWRIVLDEAHNIKNKSAKMSIAACELPGKYRWVLTGTPIQNNVDELFPLFKFLRIRPLNDWPTFKEKISDPVKKGRTKGAMQRLHVVLKAVMLRRTKSTVINGVPILHLPARNVQTVECEFDEDEQAFYEAIATKAEVTFNKFVRSGTAMSNYTSVLTLLLRLRQACSHPSLVSKDFAVDADAIESKPVEKDDDEGLADALGTLTVETARVCQVCRIDLNEDNRNANSTRCTACDIAVAVESRRKSNVKSGNPNLPPTSAKVRKILELLEEIDGKEVQEGELAEKTIVFSQFTSFLDLLQPFLRDEGIKHVRIDGSMTPDQRVKSLDKIKRSRTTNVILISFKAGSTGLNLTCCNHVILSDLWWNPALEDQAFDRAHRMGQSRDVEIYKLTIPNTVEDRILQMQESKRGLAAAALSGEKFKNNNRLKLEDLMALFRGGGKHDDSDAE